MDNITAQKVVAITLTQIRGDYQAHGETDNSVVLVALDRFESRLADNLKLAGIAQPSGRKPKSKNEPRRANIPPHVQD